MLSLELIYGLGSIPSSVPSIVDVAPELLFCHFTDICSNTDRLAIPLIITLSTWV